jgi:hypothetical protein
MVRPNHDHALRSAPTAVSTMSCPTGPSHRDQRAQMTSASFPAPGRNVEIAALPCDWRSGSIRQPEWLLLGEARYGAGMEW